MDQYYIHSTSVGFLSVLIAALAAWLINKKISILFKRDYKTLCLLASYCTLYAERSLYVANLDLMINGIRYKGSGSAHMLNRKLGEPVKNKGPAIDGELHQDVEDLWKTADGHYFLFKCDFVENALKSRLLNMDIVPLSREDAVLWARQHAHGRSIDHI